MAPTGSIRCSFFARGLCRNGDSCAFIHERTLHPNPSSIITPRTDFRSTTVCTFFQKGSCLKGQNCQYYHPPSSAPVKQVEFSKSGTETPSSQASDTSGYITKDSRASIACVFLSRPGGCRNDSCPYNHTLGAEEDIITSNQDHKTVDDKILEHGSDYTRVLLGATVSFDEIGHIIKISLPADFSLAWIIGIQPGTTTQRLADILRNMGFEVDANCIRMVHDPASSQIKATVKVEDSLFARDLSLKLRTSTLELIATPLTINANRSNCRKVHVSWHNSTRSIWMNYGNGEIAKRVAQKFNDGQYKVLGHPVKCSNEKKNSNTGFYNPVVWTIVLSNVPSDATTKDIEAAIRMAYDKPRHIELGKVSYHASDQEVSDTVRSCLEEYGPLETFYITPTSRAKRAKATALFYEETDAGSACLLNDKRLPVIGNGKLTVTMVHSAKIKVLTSVYLVSKSRIEQEQTVWKEQHLAFHVYSNESRGLTTMKIEGSTASEVVNARKLLDEIASGVIITNGGSAVWSSSLLFNGSAQKKLKKIEESLHVIIFRDRLRRQLRFHGPTEKYQQTVTQIVEILKEESSTSYEINLNTDQFRRMITGGFKHIEQVLGKNVAVFNVVLKKVTINGTRPQHDQAVAMISGQPDFESLIISDRTALPEGICPICFCEADNPVSTSCKHTYCLECLGDYCKCATSTSRNEFQVICQGDGGTCSTIFTLQELNEWLPSIVFEDMLRLSFEEYIQRHPEAFHYCPTPGCDYIYRCTPQFNLKPPAYSCANCLEPVCTSCHARHGEHTCAEYKDIASGGYEALEKLKKELNIKDCPKCTTPMEKTEGCNHMTCAACKAHICWVCMMVFETSGPCYEHMNKVHGGIGLGVEAWMEP